MDEQTVRKIIDDWHQEIRDKARLGPLFIISGIGVGFCLSAGLLALMWWLG